MTQSNRVKSAGKDGVTHVNRREKIRQRTGGRLSFVFQSSNRTVRDVNASFRIYSPANGAKAARRFQ